MISWLRKTLSDKKKSWQQRNVSSLSIEQHEDNFKSEENSRINLRIISPKSSHGIINISVPITSNGADVKIKALQQSQYDQNQIQDENMLKKFKLIRVKTKCLFSDANSLLDVQENEEFLLLLKRTDSIVNLLQHDDQDTSPTASEIYQKTKHLPVIQPSSATQSFNLENLLAQSDVSHINHIF